MSYTFDGDATEAANWYPVALTEQQSMMRLGIHSRAYSPVSGVDIVIRTTPPHIHISAGGIGIFITDGEHRIWGVSNSGVLGKEEYYKVLPEYAKIGRGIWDSNPNAEIDITLSNSSIYSLETHFPFSYVTTSSDVAKVVKYIETFGISFGSLTSAYGSYYQYRPYVFKRFMYEQVMGVWTNIYINKDGSTNPLSSNFVNWDLSVAYWNGHIYRSETKWIIAGMVINGVLLVLDGNDLILVNSKGKILDSINFLSFLTSSGINVNGVNVNGSIQMMYGARARFSSYKNALYLVINGVDVSIGGMFKFSISISKENKITISIIDHLNYNQLSDFFYYKNLTDNEQINLNSNYVNDYPWVKTAEEAYFLKKSILKSFGNRTLPAKQFDTKDGLKPIKQIISDPIVIQPGTTAGYVITNGIIKVAMGSSINLMLPTSKQLMNKGIEDGYVIGIRKR